MKWHFVAMTCWLQGHSRSEFKSCKSPEMPDEEDDIPLDLILKEEQIEVIANGTLATDEKGTSLTYVYDHE